MGLLRLYELGIMARDRAFATFAAREFAGWGDGTVIRLPVRIYGAGRIRLGGDTMVGPRSWLQTLGEGRIVIGDGFQCSGEVTISAAELVEIGRNVTFARNVHVLDNQHAHDDPEQPIRFQGITGVAPVRILDGAWIAANVVILPGVTVGRNAVVGANSVVRADVPDGALAVGAPARIVQRSKAPASGAASRDLPSLSTAGAPGTPKSTPSDLS